MSPPIWLLDVDGVVNATRPGWGASPIRRTVHAAGLDFQVRWAPKLLARIRHLIGSGAVEVRWCSTWCGNTAGLELVMGLPALESAFVVPPGRFVGELKANAARAVLWQGRRLIWTDDMETPTSGPLFDELTGGGRALLIRPRERCGLQPEDVDLVEEFCRADVEAEVAR